MPRMSPRRAWCFTHHWDDNSTPTLLDFEEIKSEEGKRLCDFAVYQTEISPTTGKHHFQGYIHTTSPTRPTQLYACGLDRRTHFEPAKGTPQQNLEYCTKTESRIDGPWIFGECPKGTGQGTRQDLRGFVDTIKRGTGELDLLDSHPTEYVKYFRAYDRIRLLVSSRRERTLRVFVIYGLTGTGKSRMAHDYDPENSFAMANNEWWDGYSGQSTLILDEYRAWLTFATLLRVTDRYPFPIPIKGSHGVPLWTTVIITTNVHPSKWYKETTDMSPFFRRVNAYFIAKAKGKFLVVNSVNDDWDPEEGYDFQEYEHTYVKFNIPQ